jgi:EAL domain-containing protein (putative c-di-GMP-specific phosphodiesterase class I)
VSVDHLDLRWRSGREPKFLAHSAVGAGLNAGRLARSFGGYSSLAQLRRLPVNTLKIDRSFVMNMADNEEDANIVRSTIELGHSLHLSVVAEGVEDPALLAQLQEYGCDIAQGFHLSKPIPPDQVPTWLNEHQPAEGQPVG